MLSLVRLPTDFRARERDVAITVLDERAVGQGASRSKAVVDDGRIADHAQQLVDMGRMSHHASTDHRALSPAHQTPWVQGAEREAGEHLVLTG